jgi:hypothetical protein
MKDELEEVLLADSSFILHPSSFIAPAYSQLLDTSPPAMVQRA